MKGIKKIIVSFTVLTALVGVSIGTVSAQTLKERNETAKVKYQQAREQYLRAVEGYKNTRQEFQNAKTKYQQTKSSENKTVLEEKAKNFLGNTVSAMINRLGALRNKAENAPRISETDRAAILAEIDKDINWLKEKQSGLANATPDQIKEQAKAVRDYWKNVRITAKKVTGLIIAARINGVIAKAESSAATVSAKIAELKSAGKDVSQLEAWLNEFNKNIALAKDKYGAAKAKFQSISNLEQANNFFKEAHQFIKEANQYIREAHKQLKQIAAEMKKMSKPAENATSTATSTE